MEERLQDHKPLKPLHPETLDLRPEVEVSFDLVAEWRHFTLFGIILPTIKLKVQTFGGFVNSATKLRVFLTLNTKPQTLPEALFRTRPHTLTIASFVTKD